MTGYLWTTDNSKHDKESLLVEEHPVCNCVCSWGWRNPSDLSYDLVKYEKKYLTASICYKEGVKAAHQDIVWRWRNLVVHFPSIWNNNCSSVSEAEEELNAHRGDMHGCARRCTVLSDYLQCRCHGLISFLALILSIPTHISPKPSASLISLSCCTSSFHLIICKAALRILALMPKQLKSARWKPSGFTARLKEMVSRQ